MCIFNIPNFHHISLAGHDYGMHRAVDYVLEIKSISEFFKNNMNIIIQI